MASFDLEPEVMITAIAGRCAALTQHKLISGTATPYGIQIPCLPALTNSSSSPLSLEKNLVYQSISVLSDYFDIRVKEKDFTGGFSSSRLVSSLMLLFCFEYTSREIYFYFSRHCQRSP